MKTIKNIAICCLSLLFLSVGWIWLLFSSLFERDEKNAYHV